MTGHDQSLQPAEIGVSTTLVTLAALAVSISLVGRIRKLWYPDYLSILSFVFACAFTGQVLSYSWTAVHEKDHPPLANNAAYSKHIFAQTFFLDPSVMFGKLAILVMYYKLFKVDKMTKFAIHVGVVFCLCTYLPRFLSNFYFCVPHPGESWDSEVYTRCPGLIIPSVVQSAMAVFLDTYIFILPIPIITRLQLNWKKRLNICLVFGFACLGIVAAAISLYFRVRFLKSSSGGDFSWMGGEADIATMIEDFVAIIVGRMPAVAGFARQEAGALSSLRTIVFKSRSRLSPGVTSASNSRGDGQEVRTARMTPRQHGSPALLQIATYPADRDTEGAPASQSRNLVKSITVAQTSTSAK